MIRLLTIFLLSLLTCAPLPVLAGDHALNLTEEEEKDLNGLVSEANAEREKGLVGAMRENTAAMTADDYLLQAARRDLRMYRQRHAAQEQKEMGELVNDPEVKAKICKAMPGMAMCQ
jgi:hypothetical protein